MLLMCIFYWCLQADAELQTLAGKLQDAEDALGKTKDHATQVRLQFYGSQLGK